MRPTWAWPGGGGDEAGRRIERRHRVDIDVDDRPSVLVGHVWSRRRTAVPTQSALAAESPVVVSDVLLGMTMDRPAVAGEVPGVVVGVALVQELDPARCVAWAAPEVAVEIAIPI